MSDTNSDDTNVLLLIPPYFFLVNSSSDEEISGTEFASSLKSTVIAMDNNSYMKNPSSTYNELHDINKKIKDLEMSANLFNHSTPKSSNLNRNLFPESSSSKNSEVFSSNRTNSKGFLKEIDNYLLLDNNYTIKDKDQSLIDITNASFKEYYPPAIDEKQSSVQLTKQTLEKHNSIIDRQNSGISSENISSGPQETPLFSLSDIWNGRNKLMTDNATVQEERLRRQHCERSIQVLQARLLEYQQKMSIALTVDRAKDEAIMKHTELNTRLKNTILDMKKELLDLKTQIDKNSNLEIDLKVSLELANKLQENNRALDIKLENLTRSSNDIRDIHKKQIDDLEVRLSNSLENEKLQHTEINQLKSQIRNLKENLEKTVELRNDLKKSENTITELRQVKSNLLEKNLDERLRYEKLEKHVGQLQHKINDFETKERNLKNEMERQKVMLKTFYQKQLEDAVRNKVDEFQKQLEIVEDNLREESKQRERLIADRAVKQMELFNHKSEQEMSLLKEKHNEEISLYRLQLVNACKTIDELNQKLHSYKNKRADIAERLHNIMETQWQKALEVITSPNQATNANETTENFIKPISKPIDPSKFNKDKLDGLSQRVSQRREDNGFSSPTTSQHVAYKTKEYSEKLNEYIDLLLKKSPRDLEKLEEVIENLKKSDGGDCKEHNSSGSGKTKPPWR